ncbi:MAG TPA: hypothetical protein PKJ69_08390, partial [Spirochaetota bacterium]|nr:hypothetical protein [Spirochaetota bacterium]
AESNFTRSAFWKHLGFLKNNVDLHVITSILVGGIVMIAAHYILSEPVLSDVEVDKLTNKIVYPFIKGIFNENNLRE